MKPIIYAHSKHLISQKNISLNAIKVLHVLNDAGFDAYLVGGAVRDLLLERKPKDFDIATNAHPEEIKRLFRNCRLIGRRFRLAHIIFGREIIEVATFRASDSNVSEKEQQKRSTNDAGFLVRDNVYGTIEEDAVRRDFTINALYYDIQNETVIDYCGGVADLNKRFLRIIGEPYTRFREDPVRMLRAVRFEATRDFTIDPEMLEPIAELGYLLQEVSSARMFDEMIKLLLSGSGERTYQRLRHYKLFGQVFSLTERSLMELSDPEQHLLITALRNSDSRVNNNLGASPYFLYGALLWEPYVDELNSRLKDNVPILEAGAEAARCVIQKQLQFTLIPKRFSSLIEELWIFQLRLTNKNPKGRTRILAHPRFKAAYDFLLLRAETFESDEVIDAADRWTKLWMESNPEQQ